MAKAVQKPCPVCRKISIDAWRPFCSKRCSDIDLGRWLGERYRVPTNDAPQDNAPNPDEE